MSTHTNDRYRIRLEMRKAVEGFMAHLPVASLLDTSIPSGLKKVEVFLDSYVRSCIDPTSSAGWTPSTFVSSRTDRAKQNTARPEDFMDEEDLAELAESRKLVDTHEEMDFGGTESELRKRAGVDPENE